MQQIGLYVVTAVLTLLIWASADQLLTETAELPMSITVRGRRGSEFVVTPAEEATRTYLVTFRGRQADVKNLSDLTSRPLTLTVEDAALEVGGLGLRSLTLLDELREHESAFPGCTIQHVDPPTTSIAVDRRITREVPVFVRTGNLDYSVEPRVSPTMIAVTLLQTQWERIQDANPRVAVNAENDMATQPEGTPIKLDVPLDSILQSDSGSVPVVSLAPQTVEVRATLRRRLKRGTIQAVPIKFVGSHPLWNRYTVQFRQPNPPDTLRITVVGPPDEVDRLASGERKTFALISLAASDTTAEGGYQFFKPEFSLPAGVQLADDETVESFEIRLVRRNETPPAGDRTD